MSLPHRSNQPKGHLLVPDLIIGTLGVLLAYVMRVGGLYDAPEAWLVAWLNETLVDVGELSIIHPAWRFVGLAAAAYLNAFILLDTRGALRRVMFWITAGLLTLSLCPVLYLYGVWYSPLPMLVAGIWSGLCSFVYVASHRMPADEKSESEAA